MQFDHTIFNKYPHEITNQEFHNLEEMHFDDSDKIKLTYNEAIKQIQNYHREEDFISYNKFQIPRFLGASLDKNAGRVDVYLRDDHYKGAIVCSWSIKYDWFMSNSLICSALTTEKINDERIDCVLENMTHPTLIYNHLFNNICIKFNDQREVDISITQVKLGNHIGEMPEDHIRYETLNARVNSVTSSSTNFSEIYKDPKTAFRYAILPSEILAFKTRRIASAKSLI